MEALGPKGRAKSSGRVGALMVLVLGAAGLAEIFLNSNKEAYVMVELSEL